MRKSIIASLRGGNLGIFGMGGVRPQDGPGPAPSARPWPVLRAGYSGRWPGRAGRRSPLSVPCGVGSGIDPLKQGPAGAGRQLPLYNYDSGCFIFDTMAESRINTLPKPDVIFSQDIISLKNNCYCNYQTGRVRFYCAGLVYLYF